MSFDTIIAVTPGLAVLLGDTSTNKLEESNHNAECISAFGTFWCNFKWFCSVCNLATSMSILEFEQNYKLSLKCGNLVIDGSETSGDAGKHQSY